RPRSPPCPYTTLFRSELVAEARNRVLMRASADAGALGRALAALLGETSDGVMLRALDDVLKRGEQLDALMRPGGADVRARVESRDRKSTRLNSSHVKI